MDVETLARTIQIILAPAVMVTACAIAPGAGDLPKLALVAPDGG